jgi:hypothetical protein
VGVSGGNTQMQLWGTAPLRVTFARSTRPTRSSHLWTCPHQLKRGVAAQVGDLKQMRLNNDPPERYSAAWGHRRSPGGGAGTGMFDRVPASKAGRCYRSIRLDAVPPLWRCCDAAHSRRSGTQRDGEIADHSGALGSADEPRPNRARMSRMPSLFGNLLRAGLTGCTLGLRLLDSRRSESGSRNGTPG